MIKRQSRGKLQDKVVNEELDNLVLQMNNALSKVEGTDKNKTANKTVIINNSESGLPPIPAPNLVLFTKEEGGVKSAFWADPFLVVGNLELYIISAGDVQANSALVVWATNYKATGEVLYGSSAINLNRTTGIQDPSTAELTKYHSFLVTGLDLETTYYFQVKSRTATETAVSETYSFATGKEITLKIPIKITFTPQFLKPTVQRVNLSIDNAIGITVTEGADASVDQTEITAEETFTIAVVNNMTAEVTNQLGINITTSVN